MLDLTLFDDEYLDSIYDTHENIGKEFYKP